MARIITETHLDANLAVLGERNADLARRLRGVLPSAEVEFGETGQGVPTAVHGGVRLASRHRPLDEAARLAESVDILEKAVVVVLGFGVGYHVRALAERLKKTGVILVLEPDLALLRAVLERIDHSGWMKEALLIFVSDPEDRAALAGKLHGAESILAQGVAFLEHPASRQRLGESARQFTTLFKEHVNSAKVTFMTTLVRSVDSIRNTLHNIDHYVGGRGVADLKETAAGRLGVVVSAGPSLARNVHLLAERGVRDRCVIIGVQTTLKPLLAAGIKPHFVTALDYHEISGRFYEGLSAEDVEGVTLVVDPKAHPAIPDAFPGVVRCCAIAFLDQLLGDQKREMGELPGGATVAHLAVYLARYLGCNPIAMIGQDLGFPDGLYYAPGTAIHDVWAPELNPFNTIAMMEWQRIVRHRVHLEQMTDVHGKSIYTDAQMLTYLQQFERDFAAYEEEGVEVIDATEGGVMKHHTRVMPLREVLERYGASGPATPPAGARGLDRRRMQAARVRLAQVRREVAEIREISRKSVPIIRQMLDDQADAVRMARHFEKIERQRREVERRLEAFELLNHLNQLGVFKRMKADRRLHLQEDLEPRERQRAQLERDLANVTWLVDAADEMVRLLDEAQGILRGERVSVRRRIPETVDEEAEVAGGVSGARVAALIPIDPDRNGLGLERSLARRFGGRAVVQATLERLGKSEALEALILLSPRGFDIRSVIDGARIGLPVEVELCEGSPFGPEQEAIAAARLFADTSWRGGIAGMSVYDEVLCPQVMHPVMERRGLTAALVAGPDWPLIDVSGTSGCDAVVRRYLEHPAEHNIVFTQAPPGLCGCLISESLMKQLAERSRLSTVGSLLVYQPTVPQGDPIARDANVRVDGEVRSSLIRATFDSSRRCSLLEHAVGGIDGEDGDSRVIVGAVEGCYVESCRRAPQHIILELTTQRATNGVLGRHPCGRIGRDPLTEALADRVFAELGEVDDWVLTLGGLGDPLLHDRFDEVIGMAKASGARAVHVRTALLVDESMLDRLLGAGVDVVTVELHADRAATYERMHGCDRFKEVLRNIDYVVKRRRHLAGPPGLGGLSLPWVVPRLRRCAETYEDMSSFFDRWQHLLGAAVMESPPPFEATAEYGRDSLMAAVTPARVMHRELLRRMTIYCDGSVPVGELDLGGEEAAGNIGEAPLLEIWRDLFDRRLERQRSLPADAVELRTFQP